MTAPNTPLDPADLRWEELVKYIDNLQTNSEAIKIKRKLEEDPIMISSIKRLVSEGWRLERGIIASDGKCEYNDQKIVLLEDRFYKSIYSRDKTFFHELAHAHYGPLLDSSSPLFREYTQNERIREAFTEWVGRRLRAKPRLLRYAVNTFGLEPAVYDLASYNAFSNGNDNSEREHYKGLEVFMD